MAGECYAELRRTLTVEPVAEGLCAPFPVGVPLDCASDSVDFDLSDFSADDFG